MLQFYKRPESERKKQYQDGKTDINGDLKDQIRYQDAIDAIYGYERLAEPGTYEGYLLNTQETLVLQESVAVTALECYFITEQRNFKVQIPYRPYVLMRIPEENLSVLDFIREQFDAETSETQREDSLAPNHVAGQRTTFYRLSFANKQQLNKFVKLFREEAELEILREDERIVSCEQLPNYVIKVAEHDVPDSVRVQIDLHIRCGCWYEILVSSDSVGLARLEDAPLPPRIRSLAYDIETSKAPLCFPNAQNGDSVMCISYMLDGFGVLIVNRAVFSCDIHDFEYSPSQDMQGKFKIFNCPSEAETIRMFFRHIKTAKPHVIVTYNGDQFDFKFIDERCTILGISMQDEIGFAQFKSRSRFGQEELEYLARPCIHIDCFRWVKRDSYLPEGSQGLKAVCREKLKYEPMELAPELMTPYAKQKPEILAQYSVSDAVATYYLYHEFIHSFILALCTIIPLNPDSVLRKGTGTLCESLLMVKASEVKLLYPDKIGGAQMKIVDIDEDKEQEIMLKQAMVSNPACVNALPTRFEELQIKDLSNTKVNIEKSRNRRLLESETYVGGRVEALHSGIYRSDIPTLFASKPGAEDCFRQLIEQLEEDMLFAIYDSDANTATIERIQKENQYPIDRFFPLLATRRFVEENVTNFQDVKAQITKRLEELMIKAQRPFEENPIIVHLDVAAMYPNIILTNRLQPHSVVDDEMCGTCDYNFPENNCKRNMAWTWRGIYYPCTVAEYTMLRENLMQNNPEFESQSNEERLETLEKQLDKYCQEVYKARTKSLEVVKQSTICERENPFFVDTVRSFRDLRYVYKKEQKKHSIKYSAYMRDIEQKKYDSEQDKMLLLQRATEEKQRTVLNESLQLAHKAILNSFYGYAMREGSRWFSLEMAACVTFIGAQIIKNARQLVELVGSPLELDTDGIWCMLPSTFPMVYSIQYKDSSEAPLRFEYPTTLLNSRTARLFSNTQFQRRLTDDIEDADFHSFRQTTECTIRFELDGPYRAMFLSAAKEEGKQIKKRYAVFNKSGDISELKGFELKRRGELQLVKSFEQRIFERFLDGSNIEESYRSAAAVASEYYNIILTAGANLDNQQLEFLLEEQTTMKKSLETSLAAHKKGTAITCAMRLAQAIDPIFNLVESLTCVFIISKYPLNTPVSERAIPVQIFEASAEKQAKYLRMWTGQSTVELSELLDWEYYGDRFRNCLYRIIVIPAGLQLIPTSPIPQIPYPDWLQKFVSKKGDVEDEGIYRYLANDSSSDQDDDSEDDNPRDPEQEERKEEVTVEEVMLKHGIKLDEVFDIAALEKAATQNNNFISRSADYLGWIQRQKEKWRSMIDFQSVNIPIRQMERKQSFRVDERVRSNDIFSEINLSGQQKCVVLGLSQEAALVVALLYCPGRECFFRAQFDVPQQFYINSKEELSQSFMKAELHRSASRLPRGEEQFYLYCVEMGREVFAEQRDLLMQVRNSPLVENIYELQVGAIETMILSRSNFVEISNEALAQIERNNPIKISELHIDSKMEFTEKQQFFFTDSAVSRMEIGFLAHLTTTSGDIALFVWMGQAVVFTSCAPEELSDEQLKILTFEKFKQLVAEFSAENHHAESLFAQLDLDTSPQLVRLRSSEVFISSVHKQIVERIDGCAAIFCISNIQDAAWSLDGKRVLFVNTVSTAREALSKNLLEMIYRLIQHDNYSRLAGIPLLNLFDSRSVYGRQIPAELFVCDVLYGKTLRAHDCVLWWSKTGRPDLGKDINNATAAPLTRHTVFEQAGHYQGFSVNFTLRFAVAEILAQIFSERNVSNVPGAYQVKLLQKVVSCIMHSDMAAQLLAYLEQYTEERQSALYDDESSEMVRQELANYLHRLYNACFSCDIVPVCISQKQLILATNKLQEHLTTNQMQIYIRKLQSDGLLKIATVEYNFCYKQLLYLDASNFYALTITQTLNKRTYLDQLLPAALNNSLERIIACFLSVCADVTGVSLLQVPDLNRQAISFFDKYRMLQLDLVTPEGLKQYRQPPFSYLNQIASMLDLSKHYEVPERILVASASSPVSIYITALRNLLSLNESLKEKVKILMDSFYINCQADPAEPLRNLFVQVYCVKCGDFYQINIARNFNETLNCDLCGMPFDSGDVEQTLIDQFFGLADNGVLYDDNVYEKVALMRGYNMLLGCVLEWRRVYAGNSK